jgi:hypothetical protein
MSTPSRQPKLSRDHLLWIGTFVFECARLEADIHDAICRLLGVDEEDGLLVAGRLDAAAKFRVLRSLGQRYLRKYHAYERFCALLEIVESQFEDRDFLVHARWEYLGGRLLMASSCRLSGDPAYFRSEWFGAERLATLVGKVRDSRGKFLAAVAAMSEGRRVHEACRLAAEARKPTP